MKRIDIKTIEIKLDKTKLLNAINSKKAFSIDIEGNIEPEGTKVSKNIIVFRSTILQEYKILDPNSIIKNILSGYKPVIEDDICTIKPLYGWEHVIKLNVDKMLYHDHPNDGIEVFNDNEIEDYGWYGVVCDVSYRDIADFIEKNCEGSFVYYDNDISFNGFAVVDDIESVRVKVKDFVISKIKSNMANEEIDLDDYDVQEALEFFGLDE